MCMYIESALQGSERTYDSKNGLASIRPITMELERVHHVVLAANRLDWIGSCTLFLLFS